MGLRSWLGGSSQCDWVESPHDDLTRLWRLPAERGELVPRFNAGPEHGIILGHGCDQTRQARDHDVRDRDFPGATEARRETPPRQEERWAAKSGDVTARRIEDLSPEVKAKLGMQARAAGPGP
jgi:hypothetical protein